MRSQPVIIKGSDGTTSTIKPWPMVFDKSEEWLQGLIQKYPQLLPIDQIEPNFGIPVPVAMEVSCTHGYIDNLFLTPNGDLILIEVKLWKNPEARREVVAQTLDYIASLSAMGFEAVQAAVLKARSDGAVSLHSLIPEHLGPLPESDFVDAIARNLRRRRILAIIVGDGIREEAELLVDLLQSHAGAHFTLALVAITFFVNLETDDLIAVPDTLLRTVMVERGIVVVDDGAPVIKPVPPKPAKTISVELFDEALAKIAADLPNKLHALVDELGRQGVFAEQKKSLQLFAKVSGVEAPIKLGYVDKYGKFWTDNVLPSAPQAAARQYLATLAALIGGSVKDDPKFPSVTTNGKAAPLIADYLDVNRAGFIGAIEAFILAAQEQGNIDRRDAP